MKTIILFICLLAFSACEAQSKPEKTENTKNMTFKIEKSEEEWKKQLTPEQYYVIRQKGTERPYTGEYNMFFKDGVYSCAACQAPLFQSDSKFDSHCGWPSFDKAIADSAITEITDRSHGMIRTEILCSSCGGHLGHVFNDGPTQTGLRYCVNSLSINFEDKKEK